MTMRAAENCLSENIADALDQMLKGDHSPSDFLKLATLKR